MDSDPVFTRRSIRKYTAEPIDPEAVTRLLQAAMAAPSANNLQPWEFVVTQDPALLCKVPDVHPYASMVPEAKALITVCADPTRQSLQGYWVQDCAAATENILIEAAGLGLGAVWLGVYPREERIEALRKLFAIPQDRVPFAMIPVGHPASHPGPSDRYDVQRIHWNTW